MSQLITHATQLGQLLKARRRALELTQHEVATKLAITQNRLSQLEADAGNLPVARLIELLNVLGLDLAVAIRPSPAKSTW